MKIKHLPKLLIVLLAFAVISAHKSFAFSGSGAGTSGDPYLITTCDEFKEINTDAEHLSAHYSLETSELNCQSDGNSIMVGHPTSFGGVFEGNNNKIIIDIDIADTDNVGLFRITDEASIIDLHLDGEITVTGESDAIGAFGGYSYSSVFRNVHSSVTIQSSGENVGGIAGWAENTSVQDSSVQVANVQGSMYVGGIVGYMEGSSVIVRSYFDNGVVTGTEYIGGLAGILADSETTIAESFSYMVISGTTTVGGIAGLNNGTIDSAYNVFMVTGKYYVGGVVGYNNGTVQYAYNRGTVTARDDAQDIGGVAGQNSGSGAIYQSFNVGNIVLEGASSMVGGVIGYSNGEYLNLGWYTGVGVINAIGYDDAIDSPVADVAFNASSRAEFSDQDISFYSAWNFEFVWVMCGYPIFVWYDDSCGSGGDDDEDSDSNTFNKDKRCHDSKPAEMTWIILEPTTKNGVSGMMLTWTQYNANKISIKIDDGTGKYPWQIEKTLNDGHEFLENVANWQNIKIQAVNGCKKGEWSIPYSQVVHTNGWYNL